MIKVVCNASLIIGLSQLGLLNILYEMFEVYVPREVYNEITLGRDDDPTGKQELLGTQAAIKLEEIVDELRKNRAEVLIINFNEMVT